MNHEIIFIKDDESTLTLRVEGTEYVEGMEYTAEDAYDLIGMMKSIVLLAEKTPVGKFAEMLNQSDDIWI